MILDDLKGQSRIFKCYSCLKHIILYKLGVILNDKLTWNDHVLYTIYYILRKGNRRIYCVSQLVHAGVKLHEIIRVYCSIIRSVLQYCCQVWHPGLTGRQSDDIERVQKRCLKIVLPDLSYSNALSLCRLDRLDIRRERLTRELFEEIKKPNHIVHNCLAVKNNTATATLRSSYQYIRPRCYNNRPAKSFINYCLLKKY